VRQQETKMQYYIITSPLLCDGLAKMCTSDLSNDEQDNSANEERPNKLIQHAAFVNVTKSQLHRVPRPCDQRGLVIQYLSK